MLDKIAAALEKIAKFFDILVSIGDHVKNTIIDFWHKLTSTGVETAEYFVNRLYDTIDYAIDSIDDIIYCAVDVFRYYFDDLSDVIDSAVGSVAGILSDMHASILQLQETLIKEIPELRATLTETIGGITETISNVPNVFWNYMAENAAQLGDKTLESMLEILQAAAADMELDMAGLPHELSIATSYAGPAQWHQFLDWAKDILTTPGRMFYELILNWLRYEPPADPEKAMNAVGRYIETVMFFTIMPMLLAKLPDFIHPLKNYRLDAIFRQLYWSLGLGWLSWIVFAEPFRALIADPLSEYFRKVYKTAPVPRSLYEEAFRKHIITEDGYKKALEDLGYRDDAIALFIATAFNPPTESVLKWALEHGLLEYEKLEQYSKWKGYDDEGTSLYRLYLMDKAIEKEKDLTLSQILRMYKLGIIDYFRAVEMIKKLGYSEDKARLLVELELADQYLELQELKIKIVLEDLKDGIIDEKKAIMELLEIGVDRQKAELLVKLTLARKRKEVREKITKADIRALYEHALIDRETAKELLVQIGYAEQVAEMLIDVWDMELADETKQLSKSEILKAYELGLIDRETAKKYLIDLGYDSETAELIIKIKEYEERHEILESKIKLVLEDLRDGYITREEAVKKLIELGVSEERAIVLVELTLAKARVERRQAPTLSQIHQFWKYGLIDDATAKEWLKIIGYTDNLAELFLKLWKLQTEPDQKEASRSLIVQAFRYGILDYQQALNMLKEIGYSEELAKMILDIEVAKEVQDLTNDKAENILLKYRYGLITEEEAKRMLYDLGLSPARVEVLIERERIRKEKPEKPRRVSASMVLRALREGLITIEEADEWLKELGYTIDKDRYLMIALYIADVLREQEVGE